MADAPPLIAAVAILGRAGAPLYFKSFGGDEAARLQFAVFTALDVISARVAETRALAPAPAPAGGASAAAAAPADRFLGLLFPVEEHKVFGFVSNGNVKFIVVVRDVLLLEDRMREASGAPRRRAATPRWMPFNPSPPTLAPPPARSLPRPPARSSSASCTGGTWTP